MRAFSSSDLAKLRGKPRQAVELLYVENHDAGDVARRLMVGRGGLSNLVSRARRQLAAVGVRLGDRRRAASRSG